MWARQKVPDDCNPTRLIPASMRADQNITVNYLSIIPPPCLQQCRIAAPSSSPSSLLIPLAYSTRRIVTVMYFFLHESVNSTFAESAFRITRVYEVTDKAPFSQQAPFEKRTIYVNETVSTVVALVYLVVWLVGMIAVCAFCCRSRPRDRKLNLNLPWRRAKDKRPEGSDMGLTVWSAFLVNMIRAHICHR